MTMTSDIESCSITSKCEFKIFVGISRINGGNIIKCKLNNILINEGSQNIIRVLDDKDKDMTKFNCKKKFMDNLKKL